MDIDGAYNVRDLGGYETADGRMTRWRTFVRADEVSSLPASSRAALVDYGIKTVVDLRRPHELENLPNGFADSGEVTYLHVDLAGDGIADNLGLPMPAKISTMYVFWLERQRHEIARTLSALAAPGALPALYHCVGGQDRTGVISALLLGLAGVKNETIAEDYTLTAEYRPRAYLGVDGPDVDPAEYTPEAYRARNCPPEVMLETLTHIDDQHGGIEGYVRAIGLGQEQIDALRKAIVE